MKWAYLYFVKDEGAAAQMVAGDPFQRAALLQQWWLKAWEPTHNSR